MQGIHFTDIKESDLPLIKEIYDYYIFNSTSTYYTDAITLDELKAFVPVAHPKYKSFMIFQEEAPIGFCYLSQYKKRQAYDRTAEVSVYLGPEFTGHGFGKTALKHLEAAARNAGISVLIGIISADNIMSVRLFKSYGYEKCGHLKQIGEKFGKLLDVVFFEKIIDNSD